MAINLAALKTELTTDPLGLGYVTSPINVVTGQVDADILNLVRATIDIDRTIIPAHEVIEAIVPAEWAALTAAEKQRIELITGAGEINVKGTNTRAAFLAAFAPGTDTRTNLAALQTRDGSRAEQLFGQSVTATDVCNALVS